MTFHKHRYLQKPHNLRPQHRKAYEQQNIIVHNFIILKPFQNVKSKSYSKATLSRLPSIRVIVPFPIFGK